MKKDKYYFWSENQPTYDINHIPNSKDLPDTIIESMGLYIHRKESALKTKRRYGNNPYLIFGSLEELIDVNNPDDLVFAETYAKGKKLEENKKFQMIKHLASSPLLSDILDDLYEETGIIHGAVLNGWKSNLSNSKLLGRASTLKLRALRKDEDFNGIYKALESYREISENDVIVVENELKNYAYFGDLNARLSIRAGASGAIIDGVTRDLKHTQSLNFPVFARGYNAADVRKRATLDYINKPITIDNVKISPGDLIFMDDCSMVVIYQNTETAVLNKIISTLNNEKNIINDIFTNVDTKVIIETRGAF